MQHPRARGGLECWRCCRCLREDTEPELELRGFLSPEDLDERGLLYARWIPALDRDPLQGNWVVTTCAACVFLAMVETIRVERGAAIRVQLAEAVAVYRKRRAPPLP